MAEMTDESVDLIECAVRDLPGLEGVQPRARQAGNAGQPREIDLGALKAGPRKRERVNFPWSGRVGHGGRPEFSAGVPNSDTKTQDRASAKIVQMRSAAEILGANLVAAFKASELISVRELARKADMSPNTVLAMMYPAKRPPNAQGVGAPRLDRIEALAHALGLQAWELLLPDFTAGRDYRVITTREFDAIRILKAAR